MSTEHRRTLRNDTHAVPWLGVKGSLAAVVDGTGFELADGSKELLHVRGPHTFQAALSSGVAGEVARPAMRLVNRVARRETGSAISLGFTSVDGRRG